MSKIKQKLPPSKWNNRYVHKNTTGKRPESTAPDGYVSKFIYDRNNKVVDEEYIKV